VNVPTPGKNGCSPAFSKLGDLLADLAAKNPASAGTVWIGKHYHQAPGSGKAIIFDGLILSKLAQHALTVQAGWNGPGEGTLDPNTPTVMDETALVILNWNGPVTLRNFRVHDVATGDCSGAISVGTTGHIKLDRIQASGNTMNGATLDNTASISSPPASVTVINSRFSENYIGLMIGTKGAVNLANIWAQDNMQRGVSVDNTYGSGDVLLKGPNTFLGNGSHGLEIDSNGQVTAQQLVAYANGLTTSASGVHISAKKEVNLSDSGQFKGNGGHGLEVYSNGYVTAQNLTATTNGGSGLWLTSTVRSETDVHAVALQAVNADGNTQSGIALHADGKLSLISSSIYDNTGSGLYVRGATNPNGPAGGLKLQGFLSYLNGTDEDILTAAPVTRTI
jgi:hypothetical protein